MNASTLQSNCLLYIRYIQEVNNSIEAWTRSWTGSSGSFVVFAADVVVVVKLVDSLGSYVVVDIVYDDVVISMAMMTTISMLI